MEQEPTSPELYGTVKRVGFNLALAAHAIFILLALVGAAALLWLLLTGS